MKIIETYNIISNIWNGNKGLNKLIYPFHAIAWQLRKRLRKSFVTHLWNGSTINVHPSSAYSGAFYFRTPDESEIMFIRNNSFLSDTFIDVGANVGLFSAYLFDKFSRFILFEPSPSTFNALKETTELNDHTEFELHNVGVGDKKEVLRFLDEGGLSSTSRFVNGGGDNMISVPVDTLDNLLKERFESVILKVDVEGYEEKVFNGASRLFENKMIKLLVFERLGRTNLDKVREFFEKHDYIVFRVLDDCTISTNEEVISIPLINLFACPNEVFPDLNINYSK